MLVGDAIQEYIFLKKDLRVRGAGVLAHCQCIGYAEKG